MLTCVHNINILLLSSLNAVLIIYFSTVYVQCAVLTILLVVIYSL